MKYLVYALSLLAATAQAEVYKSINADGEVIYSDVPSQGAARIQMPELSTYTHVPLPVAPPAPAAVTQVAEVGYSAFSLTRPDNEETIHRSNDGPGMVDVSVALEPGLQVEQGHRIQYFLDDQPQGKPVAGLSTRFLNVDRGIHKVSAAVVDDSGKAIIKTAQATIYIRR